MAARSSALQLAPTVTVPSADDAQLMLRARQERPAFELLYRRYEERVYRYFLLRHILWHDAEDLTQQVFTQAYTHRHRFDPARGLFAAWLFRIAHDLLLNTRRVAPTISWEQLAATHQPTDPGDLAAGLIHQEELERLQYAWQRLPPAKQDVLALRYGAGLTAREIGVLVGKSEEAAQKMIERVTAEARLIYGE